MHEPQGLLQSVWRFLRPQAEELVGYVAAVTILGAIAAYQLAAQGTIGLDNQDIIAATKNVIGSMATYLSSGTGWAKFFLFGFWFIVGAITYFLAWFIINVIVDVYNDIVISAAFVHPRSFSQSDYWASIIGRGAVRVMAGIALVFYGVFWIAVFAPLWTQQFQAYFQHLTDMRHAISLVTTIGLIAVTLHVATILVRLTLMKPNQDPHMSNLPRIN